MGDRPTGDATAAFDPLADRAVGERSSAPIVSQELEPGDRIDDFDLLLELGHGSFAKVFLARQRSMQRLVAVKVSTDHGFEPQTLARLEHEYIVRVYDQRVLPDPRAEALVHAVPAGWNAGGGAEAGPRDAA
ncbi:hypothetical protein ACFWWS_38440 [Streptomyces sp. NPDC059083]|uniref:hypothetical protein n=1 Tax=Streptomyces sp. NPDC059083 TaxID=3346721 RepID=UPI0036B02346